MDMCVSAPTQKGRETVSPYRCSGTDPDLHMEKLLPYCTEMFVLPLENVLWELGMGGSGGSIWASAAEPRSPLRLTAVPPALWVFGGLPGREPMHPKTKV